MPEGTTTNKVVQLKDPTTKEPVSPVVNVGSIYDKNGNKVDNLLSYTVAGTDVPIPEIKDIASELQQQVDEKLTEVDEALAGIDTAVDDKLNESLGDISTPAQSLGLPSNASIGDLFNTLASVGDLHVWRRTTSSGTDYPVSTDRNAYQEGSDAQSAGYTRGNVVTGSFKFGQYPVPYNGLAVVRYYYSSSVQVSNDGTVSLFDEIPKNVGYDYDLSVLKGKYIRIHDDESQFVSFFKPGKIYYIPSNATFSQTGSTMNWETTVDKYQTVTGYAAIPAGTTIEYLGKLGDKSRMQIVSYVGTGTYGESNPCSITADFPIKFAMPVGHVSTTESNAYFTQIQTGNGRYLLIGDILPKEYTMGYGFSSRDSNDYGKISDDKKTIYWYNPSGDNYQLNKSGDAYYFLCIG